MSKSVLKRCLELVEEDLPTSSSSKQTKTNTNKQKKRSTIFDLIPEQKRLTVTTKTGKNQIKRKIILLPKTYTAIISIPKKKSFFFHRKSE